VVLNLAVNARDAMPSGGTLTIESANAQVGDALVATHPFMRAGPHVRLSIQDSGLGMSPEVKAHLFEPFFTTKPEGHGTGLGLATVYGIVKQSEGYILIESEPGRGTRVDLYFPRIEEAKAAAKPALPPTARGTEAVLLVEDDAQVRRIAVRALQAAGYRAIVASTGREALDLAEREGSEFDLLLTDVIMPGLNGRELAETLRRRRPNLRVLYMSGYTQDVISQAGVLDSGIEFLPKPFTPELLQESVRRALDVGWAQRLATGIGEIDAQHQTLLVRVEALEKAAREGNVSDAPNLVMLVERYASEHFATEEEFMRAAGYPGLGDHHALHRTFVDELKSRKAEYEASHPHPSALKGFSDWFTSWLHAHIRGADAEMASYLRGASS
jgi:hemerythrin-like metal-binding protein